MDRAVHAAAAQQRLVRRIDDGIDRQLGDVGLANLDALHRSLHQSQPRQRNMTSGIIVLNAISTRL